MTNQNISLVEATRIMKNKFSATWPRDGFVQQLIEYEAEKRGGVDVVMERTNGVNISLQGVSVRRQKDGSFKVTSGDGGATSEPSAWERVAAAACIFGIVLCAFRRK